MSALANKNALVGNAILVAAARVGLVAGHAPNTEENFPVKNTWCQKWVRLVIQSCLGDEYDKYMRATAADTARAFIKGGYGFYATQLAQYGALRPGDILYKTVGSGGFGHVGIYLGRNSAGQGLVAENSTFHWNRTNGKDARGIRTLEQFGAYQVVVRLPAPVAKKSVAPIVSATPTRVTTPPKPVPPVHPAPAPRPVPVNATSKAVLINGISIQTARMENGHWVANIAELGRALGIDIVRDAVRSDARHDYLSATKRGRDV
jgi:hypothetical protein